MKTQLALVLFLVCGSVACGGCETGPPTKALADARVQAASIPPDQVKNLFLKVQQIRDRNFKRAPVFEPVEKLDRRVSGGTAELQADKQALKRGLFGITQDEGRVTDISETSLATYDARTHTIRYVESAPKEELERALVFAIVEALDSENFASLPPAKSWDEELAHGAALRGTGAFVWVAMQAEKGGIDAETLAWRPEIGAGLEGVPKVFIPSVQKEGVGDRIDARSSAFAKREGFAAVSALMRSGGWSSAELVRIAPPETTLWIVRPDRRLAGEDYGTWALPAGATELLKEQGTPTAGHVGPGVATLWMSDFLDERIARSLYVSFYSDFYRYYQHDDDFLFIWVSLWRTPGDAEQVVTAFDTALRTQKEADFSALQRGATVAIVGTNKKSAKWPQEARIDLATRLLAAGPLFSPGEPEFISFEPSTFDTYVNEAAKASLEMEEGNHQWSDPATNLTLNMESLKDWKVQKTENSSVRWAAKYEADGSTILMNTELEDVFAPEFKSKEFLKHIEENFSKTVGEVKVEVSETIDLVSTRTTHHVRLTGKVNKLPTVIEFWMFKVGPVVVTMSLKTWPDVAKVHRDLVTHLMDEVVIKRAEKREKKGAGIIEFKVDE